MAQVLNKQQLVDLFKQCNFSHYESISREDVQTSLLILKDQKDGFSDIEHLLQVYIQCKSHSLDGCCCEEKSVGISFVSCVKDHKFKSGWNGLHHAVNTATHSQDNFKKQCITGFIQKFPSLLFDTSEGPRHMTPLMIAAWKSATLTVFLMNEFLTSQNRDDFKLTNKNSESVLTYSFSCGPRRDVDGRDISIQLLDKLYDSVPISIIIQASRAKNDCSSEELSFACPDKVIFHMVSKLLDIKSITQREVMLLIGNILKRKDMECALFTNIVNKIVQQDKEIFKFNKLSSRNINILEETSKLADINTNASLLLAFLNNFLEDGPGSICPSSQNNIAHYACKADNMFMIKFLKEWGFLSLMEHYNSEGNRPAFYGCSQLKVLEQMGDDCTSMINVSLDTGENIINRALKWSYKEDFRSLLSCDISLLSKCNQNDDSALHLMLTTDCKPQFAVKMIERFKAQLGDIDIRNKRGLTPLLTLCCNIDKFEDEEDPSEIIGHLIKAGADVNVIANRYIADELQIGPCRDITAEWLARMSVFHSADDPSDYAFDAILQKIRRDPRFGDSSFLPDMDLFEKLRNSNPEKYGYGSNFKIINIFGNHSSKVAGTDPDTILCLFKDSEILLYNAMSVQQDKSSSFIISTDHEQFSLKNSFNLHVDVITSHMQDVKLSQHISRKQIRLLRLLKLKMGLSYIHLPTQLLGEEDEVIGEEVSSMEVDASLARDAACTPATLQLDLLALSRLGLIVFTEDMKHIVNVPVLLSQTCASTTEAKIVLDLLRIPLISFTESLPRKTDRIKLFDVLVTSKNGISCHGRFIFKPLLDILAYLFSADLHNNIATELPSENKAVSRTLVFGSSTLTLSLGSDHIGVSSNHVSLRDKTRYALDLAVKHLHHGNIGVCDEPGPMKMRIVRPGEKHVADTSTIADTSTVAETSATHDTTTSLLSKSVTANTKLADIPVAMLSELFTRMSDEHIKVSERPTLKSECREVSYMHWFSALIRRHEGASIMEFYHIYKQDPDYEEFLVLFLKVLELDVGHMKRWRDNVTEFDKCWLTWTMVIALVLTVVTVVTSVLYDVDAGFGGIAGVPAVFLASAVIKRTCCRNKEGKYEDNVEKDMRRCGNCFA